MFYAIVFDTSADKYSAKRMTVRVSAKRLSDKIARLQEDGNVIYRVEPAL